MLLLRRLKLFSVFLKAYFESYLVVLNYFKNAPQGAIGTKDRIKKIESLGNRMYKKEEIDRKEALNEVNYRNAVKYFNSQGITSSGNSEKIDYFTDRLQRFLSLLSQ